MPILCWTDQDGEPHRVAVVGNDPSATVRHLSELLLSLAGPCADLADLLVESGEQRQPVNDWLAAHP